MTDKYTGYEIDLSEAYSFVIRNLLIDSKSFNIKDLSDFASHMNKSMMSNMEALDTKYDEVFSKYSNSAVCDGIDILKEMKTFVEPHLNEVKVIYGFINEDDSKAFYLDQYIKYFTSFIHFQKDKFKTKMVNKHPHFSSPLLLDMLTNPLFGFMDGRFTAVHTYYIENPDRPEEKIDLFSVNASFAPISTKHFENQGIAVEKLLNVKFPDLVKPEVKEMVKEIILKLTSSLPNVIDEMDIAYVVHCLLDTDVVINMVLPKKHFRLKK